MSGQLDCLVDGGTRHGGEQAHGFPNRAHLATVADVPFPRRASSLLSLALVGLVVVILPACDASSTPTSPSTGRLVVATPRTILRSGEVASLTVTNSGTPVTTAVWTTTDASVLTVSAAGQATAGRPGRVTVTATSGSAQGSLSLRVVPDVAGTWSGGVVRVQLACAAASTTPVCAPGASTGGTLTLRLTQVGDQLTGSLVDSAEPTATVPLTGTLQADDQVALAGSVSLPSATPTLRVEASTLRAAYDPTLATLTGSYTLNVDRAGVPGALVSDYRAQVQFRGARRP